MTEPTIVAPQPTSSFSTSTSHKSVAAMEGNLHIVPMPKWSSMVGCTKVLTAIIVLAFTATTISSWGGHSSLDFALFTACATLTIFSYYFIALSHKPVLYNRWAVLGLETFGTASWLITFALLADWTSTYNDSYYLYEYVEGYDIPIAFHRSLHVGVMLAGISAGLGALEFVLFAITLVVFSINLHKHRIAGNPSVFGSSPNGSAQSGELVTQTEKSDGDVEGLHDEEERPAPPRKNSSPVV